MYLSTWAWSQPHWSAHAAGPDTCHPEGVSLGTFWCQQALRYESILRSLSKPSSSSKDAIGKSLAPIPESEAELEEEDDEDEAETTGNEEEEQYKEEEEEEALVAIGRDKKAEHNGNVIRNEVIAPEMQSSTKSYEQEKEKMISSTVVVIAPKVQSNKGSFEQDPKGWQTIPKPKGHSTLDYARWDRVEDDSSEEDDEDDDESQPQYRFRVKTVGVRPVKWKGYLHLHD